MNLPVEQTTRLPGRIFLAAVALLAFAAHPLALLPPAIARDSYYVQLPAALILVLTALPLLLQSTPILSKLGRICFIVFLLPLLLQLLGRAAGAQHLLSFAACLLVPLAVAVAWRRHDCQPWLPSLCLGSLCLLLIVYGCLNIRSWRIIGITGNRNYMAICLLATLPWGMMLLYHCASRLGRPRLQIALAALLLLPVTAMLVYRCDSRGAWLALALFALYYLVLVLRRWTHRLLVLLLTGLALVMILALHSDAFQRALLTDVRLPLWHATMRAVVAAPILGPGADAFAVALPDLLSGSSYHRRLVVSELIIHPHNEVLNIAVNIGLPAALAWLLIVALIVLPDRRRASATVRVAQFSAFVIVAHGLLDRSLTQPPSSVIALACIGICMSESSLILRLRPQLTARIVIPAMLAAMAIAGWTAQASWRLGWLRRQAMQLSNGKHYQASVAAFGRILAREPDDAQARYAAGAIAVEKLMDPELALGFLMPLQQANPNYAHLNRLLGQAHGIRNETHQAVKFFARDCQLFPRDTQTLQYYFLALAYDNQLARLPPVSQRLAQLYREKMQIYYAGSDTADNLAAAWLAAVRNEDRDAAMQAVGRLFPRYLSRVFIDPLFEQSNAYAWDQAWQYSPLHASDFAYWRAVVDRADAFGAERGIAALSSLMASWSRRSPGAPPNLAWLAAGLDVAPVVCGSGQVLVHDGKQLYRFDMDGVVPADVPAACDKARLYCYPQQFMLRNHLLFVVLQPYLPDLVLGDAVEIPIVRLLSTIDRYHEAGVQLNLEDCCLDPPFAELHSELDREVVP